MGACWGGGVGGGGGGGVGGGVLGCGKVSRFGVELGCGKVSRFGGDLGEAGCCVGCPSVEDDGVYESWVSEECSD